MSWAKVLQTILRQWGWWWRRWQNHAHTYQQIDERWRGRRRDTDTWTNAATKQMMKFKLNGELRVFSYLVSYEWNANNKFLGCKCECNFAAFACSRLQATNRRRKKRMNERNGMGKGLKNMFVEIEERFNCPAFPFSNPQSEFEWEN